MAKLYDVKPNQTPADIAAEQGITLAQLMAANPNGYPFTVGQPINLPFNLPVAAASIRTPTPGTGPNLLQQLFPPAPALRSNPSPYIASNWNRTMGAIGNVGATIGGAPQGGKFVNGVFVPAVAGKYVNGQFIPSSVSQKYGAGTQYPVPAGPPAPRTTLAGDFKNPTPPYGSNVRGYEPPSAGRGFIPTWDQIAAKINAGAYADDFTSPANGMAINTSLGKPYYISGGPNGQWMANPDLIANGVTTGGSAPNGTVGTVNSRGNTEYRDKQGRLQMTSIPGGEGSTLKNGQTQRAQISGNIKGNNWRTYTTQDEQGNWIRETVSSGGGGWGLLKF